MNPFISALLMVIASAAIGLYIRNKIWGMANKPTNPFQYGRAWAGYVAFIAPLSSIHLFIQKDFINALLGFLVNLILFPGIAFFCGFIYGQLKKPVSPLNFVPHNTKSILLVSALALVAISLAFYFKYSGSDWVLISNRTVNETNSVSKYIDKNSIVKKANKRYFEMLFDYEAISGQRRLWTEKFVQEVDCSIDAMRTNELYMYKKTLKEGLGEPFFKDETYQATQLKLPAKERKSNFDGGWLIYSKASMAFYEMKCELNPSSTECTDNIDEYKILKLICQD